MGEMELPPLPSGRSSTGIPGFDEISDGGLPSDGITVVLGGAGAGKTIFGTLSCPTPSSKAASSTS
jgi:RecA/RadA recombinase